MAVVALVFSILAAVVPTVLYVLALWWFDRYEKEPLPLLIVAIFWGALPAVFFAAMTEVISDAPLAALTPNAARLIGTGMFAPIIEEIAKGVIVFAIYWVFHDEFDDALDGIIYGALVGFGFAMTENVFYFFGAWTDGGWTQWSVVVFLRAVIFGLNHAFFTSLTGLGLGIARLSRSALVRWIAPIAGLSAAIFFHGVHNAGIALAQLSCAAPLISLTSDWGGVWIVFIVILLGWTQEKQWMRNELAEEVSTGLITSADYAMACSYRERIAKQMDALLSGDWDRARRLSRFTSLLTELAFKKHQSRVRRQDYARLVSRLRKQIADRALSKSGTGG
jgi:RsiW-degrading membrane proteinase PrsW (M82 family)